jgi:hypothetical protein
MVDMSKVSSLLDPIGMKYDIERGVLGVDVVTEAGLSRHLKVPRRPRE